MRCPVASIRFEVVVALLLSSTVLGQVMPRPQKAEAPEWYRRVLQNPGYAMARGTGDSKERQLALDKATADARRAIADSVNARWKLLLEAIQEEGIMTPVATEESVTLQGSVVTRQQTLRHGKVWRAFVLVTLPEESVRSVLLERLHRDETWYEAVKETKAARELEGAGR